MKTYITILIAFITIGLTAQEQGKICFPREKQAERQRARLNAHNETQVWNNKTNQYDISRKIIIEHNGWYCIDIECEDKDLKHGKRSKRLVIKKRHYKHLAEPEHAFFNLDSCWLKHNPSKLQLFIKKLRKKIKLE